MVLFQCVFCKLNFPFSGTVEEVGIDEFVAAMLLYYKPLGFPAFVSFWVSPGDIVMLME